MLCSVSFISTTFHPREAPAAAYLWKKRLHPNTRISSLAGTVSSIEHSELLASPLANRHRHALFSFSRSKASKSKGLRIVLDVSTGMAPRHEPLRGFLKIIDSERLDPPYGAES